MGTFPVSSNRYENAKGREGEFAPNNIVHQSNPIKPIQEGGRAQSPAPNLRTYNAKNRPRNGLVIQVRPFCKR